MSRQNEKRANIGTGVGITLLGVGLTVVGYFLPGVWHDVPAAVSYLGILMGVVVILWGLWLAVVEKIDWSKKQADGISAVGEAASGGDVSASYLSDRDTELDLAVYLMAKVSAWGRWFSAQVLAGDEKPIDEQFLMTEASMRILDAALNGTLEIRGRPKGGASYEPIPREQWRLAYLDVKPHNRRLWKISVKRRDEVDPELIRRMLDYASLIVDSRQFEMLWPRQDKDSDWERLKFLEKARKAGVDPSLIAGLS